LLGLGTEGPRLGLGTEGPRLSFRQRRIVRARREDTVPGIRRKRLSLRAERSSLTFRQRRIVRARREDTVPGILWWSGLAGRWHLRQRSRQNALIGQVLVDLPHALSKGAARAQQRCGCGGRTGVAGAGAAPHTSPAGSGQRFSGVRNPAADLHRRAVHQHPAWPASVPVVLLSAAAPP